MKIVNELNYLISQHTDPIEVTQADIEKFKAYASYPYSGNSDADFLEYLPNVLRYVYAHPKDKGNGAPDIAFEWLKTLSTEVRREVVPCGINKNKDWMYPRFVGLHDSGLRMDDVSVDAFELEPNVKSEVFAIKPSADGKYYEFYYSISDKLKAETENLLYFFEYPINRIRNNYTGDKIESGLWIAIQSKKFNDFTSLDLGGSETVLYGVFQNKGPIEPLANQFLYKLRGRADFHIQVSAPASGGSIVARSETEESPIVLDNYFARLSPEQIQAIKDFGKYYSDYSDKRIAVIPRNPGHL